MFREKVDVSRPASDAVSVCFSAQTSSQLSNTCSVPANPTLDEVAVSVTVALPIGPPIDGVPEVKRQIRRKFLRARIRREWNRVVANRCIQ